MNPATLAELNVGSLKFEGKNYRTLPGEMVLDTLMRHGVSVPFSCRKGVCLVCVLSHQKGEVPDVAVDALRPRLREKGYFLACQCPSRSDLEVSAPQEGDLYGRATVVGKQMLSYDVCQLLLEPATSLYYHAGQFINVRRSDGLTRGYSISSVPRLDKALELHVHRVPFGRMSGFIHDELKVGDELDIQGPEGRCFYSDDDPTARLLLIGTGTGLAPLLGVARDALASGHSGPIHLYHGAKDPAGLYRHELLQSLAAENDTLHYHPSVSRGDAPEGVAAGRAADFAFTDHADLRGWRVFLCGHPEMVADARRRAIGAGAPASALRADPFETAEFDPETTEEPREYPRADPEMWEALGKGVLLRKILDDFYTRVYDDPQLSPFFGHTTKDRSIGKQWSFLSRIFSGDDGIYFGDRPRNAHHWMVISDELFDHRAALMLRVLRKHGLPEPLVRRFGALEESYRRYVVKATPWPRIARGEVYPLDGYDSIEITIGSLCDSCERAIDVGETAWYHLRLGTLYCADCRSGPPSQAHSSAGPPASRAPTSQPASAHTPSRPPTSAS